MIGRRITAAGIALILLIVAADTYEAWQDYQEAVRDNERGQRALGRVLAEQTARMIQESDLTLSGYTRWVLSPDGRTATPAAKGNWLQSEFGRLPFVRAATVTAADGHVIATTREDGAGNRSLERRMAFTGPRDANDAELYIGRPYVASRDRSVNVSLSRRVDDPSGAFAGVVVASLAFDYLVGFYSEVDITNDTAIRLERQDGVVLARYPVDAATALGTRAEPIAAAPSWNSLAGAVERVGGEVAPDGSRLVVALRRVEGYPLVVQVTRPLNSVLQPWLQREAQSAARTLTLVLLAVGLLVALHAALRRRDRLERQLENSQRADALGFLAASIAHDFNNVLSAIVGYAELTRTSVAPDSPANQYLERLLAATERARLMVRRVLTFNPRRSTDHRPLCLEPIVVEVIDQLRAMRLPLIEIRQSCPDPRLLVSGEATELHQVVMNLCTNAVHAMPRGGTLEVKLTPLLVTESRSLTVGQLQPGHWACLSVIDTGIGMDAARVESIFQPFYTTREAGQGSGIGLSVVHNIVLRMGGAIDVSSQAGAGTTVSVYLPLADLAPEVKPVSLGTPRQQGRGETVMVIDDEAELVAMVEELLASMGYEPVGFTDVLAALDAFRRDPARFDLVLTDERMPVMRGVEVAGAIRQIDPRMPVVMMTGHRDAGLDAAASDVGVGEILDKPIRALALLAALERRIRRQGALTA